MQQAINRILSLTMWAIWLLIAAQSTVAQTTQFTYQGKLNNSGAPANGSFDLNFKLFDNLTPPGNQLGSVALSNVTVIGGIFTVTLDFGACSSCFNGSARFLEIEVRPAGVGLFTTLSPRQPVTSNPYAIKSLNAATADGLSVACVNCVTSTQIASAPAGSSSSYVQNTTTPQPLSDFNISGNGTANILNATTQYNIGGIRVLSAPGSENIFAGTNAGTANTVGNLNSFVGAFAGWENTTGGSNTFVGAGAGQQNRSGSQNSFFGYNAGFGNGSGSKNTLLGYQANVSSPFLTYATALGASAIVTASNTIVLGRDLDTVQVPGSLSVTGPTTFAGTLGANIFNATAQYNIADSRVLSVAGINNTFAGLGAGTANNPSTGDSNSFFGSFAGNVNTNGDDNSFFGASAGSANTGGYNGSFFGARAGSANTTGFNNSIFGLEAGSSNTSGCCNSFFGTRAGRLNMATANSFFGESTGVNNSTGANNSFFGQFVGSANTSGSNNTLIGASANVGSGNLTNATAIGANAVVSQSNSLVLGNNATVGIGTDVPTFKLDIIDLSNKGLSVGTFAFGGTVAHFGGRGAFVIDAEGIAGGRLNIAESGLISFDTLGSGGATHLCRNPSKQISDCSSSARYKSNINPFRSGLSLVKQLRPVSFNWKDGGMLDMGLVAEEVAVVEPLLITTNAKGEIEGVKYDRVGVVLVNAVQEQQTQIDSLEKQNQAQQKQIERQQKQIDSLKLIVCSINPQADNCK